jgi:O-succinylbenzoate synthase
MITGYTLYRSDVQCKRPFQIATGIQDRCHGLILELKSDGVSGWGEGVPLPYLTGETFAGCEAALTDVLLPALIASWTAC